MKLASFVPSALCTRRIVILGVSIVLGVFFAMVSHSQSPYAPVNDVAFTAEIVEASGIDHPQPVKHLVQAYRADSSRATAPIDRSSSQARSVTLLPEGMKVDISDRGELKSTRYFRVPPGTKTFRAWRGPRCEYQGGIPLAYKGQDVINGFEVYGYETVREEPPSKKILRTAWFAKDLGCYEMKLHEEVQDGSGKVISVFERTAVKITPGDPDPSLFDVPPSYREVPPSEMERNLITLLAKDRGDISATPDQAIKALSTYWKEKDAAYDEAHRHR